MQRLQSVVGADLRCRDGKWRQAAGVACPLGHAMCHLRDITLRPATEEKVRKVRDESTSLDVNMGVGDAFANAFADFNSTASSMEETDDAGMMAEEEKPVDEEIERGKRYYLTADDQKELPLGSGNYQKWFEDIEDTSDGPIRVVWTNTDGMLCSCCDDPVPFNGYYCPLCEKALCQNCAHVYCKQGHEMKIGTSGGS